MLAAALTLAGFCFVASVVLMACMRMAGLTDRGVPERDEGFYE